MNIGSFLIINNYPELKNYDQTDRVRLLSLARYNTFRIKGNSAKLVLVFVPVVLFSIFIKVSIDLLLVNHLGKIVSGFVSFAVVVPIAYFVLVKRYSMLVRPELEKLLYDREAT